MSRNVRIVQSVNDVDQSEWDALVAEDDSPFVEWTWLSALERSGCATRETGWLGAHWLVEDDGKLIAALPAYIRASSEGEFVFDFAWADAAERMGALYYPKVVIGVPFTPATGGRLLCRDRSQRNALISEIGPFVAEWSAKQGLGGVHVLFATRDEAQAWADAGFLLRKHVQFHLHRNGRATFDDYLTSLTSKRRRQIKHEIQSLRAQGINNHWLTPEELTPHIVKTMYDFYASTVQRHHWGNVYLNEAFFSDIATRFATRLAWVVAKRDGAILAGAFNVKKGKTLYGRYWGCGEQVPFLHFDTCYYAGVAYALENGCETFEPGAGGEHKYLRGFDSTLTYSAHFIADDRLSKAIARHLVGERAHYDGIVTRRDDA